MTVEPAYMLSKPKGNGALQVLAPGTTGERSAAGKYNGGSLGAGSCFFLDLLELSAEDASDD